MKQQLRILACLAVMGFVLPAQAQEQKEEQKEEQKTPDIGTFINHIWEASPMIAEAEAKVAAAKAGQKAAGRWRYNPDIEYEREDKDGAKKTNLIGVSQTIDWSGKFLSSGKTAEFEWMAASAERDNVRQNVAVNVLAALADYSAAQDVFSLALRHTGLMERFAGLAGKRFKAGDIDQSEYNLAQLAMSESLITQADAETMLAEGKQGLDSSIGFPLENGFALPKLAETLPELPSDSASEDEILMGLPHLRAIKNREEAAKAVITQARKDMLPDPTIGVSGGKDEGTDIIGFSMSVPLHVFNTFGAEVDVAKQEALAQAKAFQSAYHAAKTRLQASRRSYQLSKRAWENWQGTGALALADQTETLDLKYAAGDLSTTDYLVRVEQIIDTQVAAEELHAKVWRSWFAFLAASGKTEQWIQNTGE